MEHINIGGYKVFYIKIPKERKIESSRYIDRIVHRWYVDSFMEEYFIKQFIENTYACIKNRGMHKAAKDVRWLRDWMTTSLRKGLPEEKMD